MRAISGPIFDLWASGGPFIGAEGKPHTRVTVEIGWTLGEYNLPVGDFSKPPLRYVQTEAQDQVETEIPNIQSVRIDRSIDQDAATIAITMVNNQHNAIGDPNINDAEFGNPGYFSFSRGDSPASLALWGHTANAWNDVLVPNALLRSYQGLGGHDKTLAEALEDGNLIQTGIWLLDEVKPATGGLLELNGRDLAKLLIDQPLYPPLVPMYDYQGCDVWPLQYARYFFIPGTQTATIYYGEGGAIATTKKIVGIEYAPTSSPCRPDLEGYWLPGDDGGSFAYGYVNHHGSLAGATLSQPVVGMAATGTNNGYWLATADGGVFCFGDADFFESLPSLEVSVTNIIGIERSRNGSGYMLAGSDGGVFAFGDAEPDYDGNAVGIAVGDVVGFDTRKTGDSGYWLCTNEGYVYAFGAAGYFGGINGAGGIDDVVGMASTPTGAGYYLLRSNGAIYTYGDAQYYGSPAEDAITLNDPATDLAVHPDGGYWIAAEDGGVFTYGPGLQFYGSLPGPWVNLATVTGNYFDLTDVIKDIVRWSGLWLYDGGVSPEPHGTFESTGIVSNDENGELPPSLFDGKAGIDVINELKAIVGFTFRVDEEGGCSWGVPNWWAPGNYLPDGSHTDVIPEINEGVNMTGYAVLYGDKSMRSKITIASYQPLSGVPGTVLTDYTPANVSALRGLHKPFPWVNKVFVKAEEQQIMAELIDLHINMQRRLGSVTCAANPLVQVGDQVRIVERVTSETYIHFVRSISTSHDLVSGVYNMTLQTNWLGDEDEWAIFTPSALVRPATIETTTTFGAVAIGGASTASPAPGVVFLDTIIPTPAVSVS